MVEVRDSSAGAPRLQAGHASPITKVLFSHKKSLAEIIL
jgi:hypothetical protein